MTTTPDVQVPESQCGYPLNLLLESTAEGRIALMYRYCNGGLGRDVMHLLLKWAPVGVKERIKALKRTDHALVCEFNEAVRRNMMVHPECVLAWTDHIGKRVLAGVRMVFTEEGVTPKILPKESLSELLVRHHLTVEYLSLNSQISIHLIEDWLAGYGRMQSDQLSAMGKILSVNAGVVQDAYNEGCRRAALRDPLYRIGSFRAKPAKAKMLKKSCAAVQIQSNGSGPFVPASGTYLFPQCLLSESTTEGREALRKICIVESEGEGLPKLNVVFRMLIRHAPKHIREFITSIQRSNWSMIIEVSEAIRRSMLSHSEFSLAWGRKYDGERVRDGICLVFPGAAIAAPSIPSLAELMTTLGVPDEDVCVVTGASVKVLHAWKSGYGGITVKQIDALGRALRVSTNDAKIAFYEGCRRAVVTDPGYCIRDRRHVPKKSSKPAAVPRMRTVTVPSDQSSVEDHLGQWLETPGVHRGHWPNLDPS